MISTKMFYSEGTKKLLEDDVREVMTNACEKFNVPENLVLAIIRKESDFQPFALRYEKHLPNTGWYKKTIPEEYKTNKYAYCSMGLMQILYGIARDEGYEGAPFELFAPSNSLYYSIKFLGKLYKKYDNADDAISSYNQGKPRKDDNGKYKNQYYVDKVNDFLEDLGGI